MPTYKTLKSISNILSFDLHKKKKTSNLQYKIHYLKIHHISQKFFPRSKQNYQLQKKKKSHLQ